MKRKIYGHYQTLKCYFCGKQATTENKQGLPTCINDKSEQAEDKKCVCGEFLDIKKGKYGAFYLCTNCGPVSIKKADNMENSAFKPNIIKKEKKKVIYQRNKTYTLKELEDMWK